MRVHEFYNYLDSRKKKGGQDALATVYRIVAAELLTRGKAENQSWLFKLDNTRREIIKKNMREIHAARMQKRNDKITSLAS